jgi:hypothetical protein
MQNSSLRAEYGPIPSRHIDLPSIPAELQDSVQRHQRHLAALVSSLRAAGLTEEVIDASVRQLLDSYHAELTSAMRALLQDTARA